MAHDTLKWIGISFFPALFALWMGALAWVDQFPENKPWLAQFYGRLEGAMHTPAFWAIAVAVFLAWLIALIYSGHKVSGRDRKTDFAGLADLIREIRRDDPAKANPDSATHTMSSTQALEPELFTNAQEFFPPSVRAISPLYVGQIVISAARLGDGSIELAVLAFNGSRETITLASVHGAILAGINNAVGVSLPTPTLRAGHVVGPVEPGTEFLVILDQPLPGALAQTYLDVLNAGGYIALDLRELKVLMRAEDDANLTAPLPLWHGASIRRRDDIFSNRIIMGSISAAAEISFKASGTLKDATDGEG